MKCLHALPLSTRHALPVGAQSCPVSRDNQTAIQHSKVKNPADCRTNLDFFAPYEGVEVFPTPGSLAPAIISRIARLASPTRKSQRRLVKTIRL
jgi:hypothetical protein